MTPVCLRLSAPLLRRFRSLAAECLSGLYESGADGTVYFHVALRCALAEFLLAHADGETVLGPPASLSPTMPVYSAAPPEAVHFVAELARRSGLSVQDCWHLVVLEFCERDVSPALEVVPAAERAA